MTYAVCDAAILGSSPPFACLALASLIILFGALNVPLRRKYSWWGTYIDDFSGESLLQGAVWKIISSTFLHASWVHAAEGLQGLFLAGVVLEAAFGPMAFLAIYFACGAAGCVVSWLLLRRKFALKPPFEGLSAQDGVSAGYLTPQ